MALLRLLLSLVFGGVMSWLRSVQARIRGNKEGRAEAKAEVAVETLENVARAKEIENEVEGMDRVRLRDRAGRWVRGSDPK